MSSHDAVRARFAATAERIAARTEGQSQALRGRVARFVAPAGDERALDAGTGAGALAFALAPLVREVVGVDVVPELLAEARRLGTGVENVSFVEADVTRLPFEDGWFDLACTHRTLHHVARPELAIAELVRVTRPGGRLLVVDQIAPVDPLAALELNRFEQARDPSHARALADVDLRHLFEANGLLLRSAEFLEERRLLDPYFELAGCEGEERERARSLSPGDGVSYTAAIGWYLLAKPAA